MTVLGEVSLPFTISTNMKTYDDATLCGNFCATTTNCIAVVTSGTQCYPFYRPMTTPTTTQVSFNLQYNN